jgi:hypothetical protein
VTDPKNQPPAEKQTLSQQDLSPIYTENKFMIVCTYFILLILSRKEPPLSWLKSVPAIVQLLVQSAQNSTIVFLVEFPAISLITMRQGFDMSSCCHCIVEVFGELR